MTIPATGNVLSKIRQFIQFYEDAALYAQNTFTAGKKCRLPASGDSFQSLIHDILAGRNKPSSDPLRVVLLSPHPDDEVLSGALACRLKSEYQAQITNVALTLGSREDRKNSRLAELQIACERLGFSLVLACEPPCFNHLSAQCRSENPADWQVMVDRLSASLQKMQPDLLLYPHANDDHPTHHGAHLLAVDAINQLHDRGYGSFWCCETGVWTEVSEPNLLMGVSGDDLAQMIFALLAHEGELSRNPYHLRMPARMMLKIEKGCEQVMGRDCHSPAFLFGDIYRIFPHEKSTEAGFNRKYVIPPIG